MIEVDEEKSVSEFDEWAKRFEASTTPRGRLVPAQCMYPVKEGPHKVAHLVKATTRSADGYPSCKQHKNNRVRAAWRGYVEGA
jgi:hypothetical protein